jgi:predicted transcriptional regulator
MSATTPLPDQLPLLIQSVYGSLAGLGQAPAPVEENASLPFRCARRSRPMPSPASNAAQNEDAQAPPVDGSWSDPAEYRSRWNLAADYPMVAPDYAAKRKELAVKIGLGRKPKAVVEVALRPKRQHGARN